MTETQPSQDFCHHQMKLPIPRMGYAQLNCLQKKHYGNPQTIQAITKAVDCSPQTHGKALLPKTTHP